MRSINIGVVAYGVDPSMVFVRIPNERARWLLVDRSVVEVDCRWCGAVAGEPCRRYQPGERSRRRNGIPEETIPPEILRYGVAVHVRRKEDAKAKHGGGKYAVRIPPYKLRIRADELAELQTPIHESDEELVEIEPRAIAAVKKAAPMIGMWVEAEAAANGGKIHPVTSREVERVLWEANTRIEVTPR